MKKLLFICLCVLSLSCQQDKRMKSIKTIVFETNNDIYREGFSDTEHSFLFYTTNGNNMLYKYYLNSDKRDTIDLAEKMKIKRLSRYNIFFNKEDYIVNYGHANVYNSVENVVYKLDSLSNYNGMEYTIALNNASSWKNNKLLLTNLFTCDLYGKGGDLTETFIACEQLNKQKPSYSILDFENSEVESSTITFKDIKPKTKDNSAEIWFKATAIYVKDVILYNNHFIDAVYEVDEAGSFKKAFSVKSKYTNFEEIEIFKSEDVPTVYDNAINYATQVNGILYDEYHNKILVVLVHGTKDIENNGEKKFTNRPFSILVYDTDYNFEKEYLFDHSKYDYHGVFVCKEGLIINANNKLGDAYEPQKLIYEIFSY